jgi:hypothetical protein
MGRIPARRRLLLIADVARGDGKDSSAFHVFKISSMQQVAEYLGKPSLDMYSNILNQVGKEYGNALLVVENIGIGISVLEKLELLGYTNLYYSMKGITRVYRTRSSVCKQQFGAWLFNYNKN